MTAGDLPGPRGTILFRVVALFARFQLGTLVRTFHHPHFAVVLFVLLSGIAALATLTAAALWTRLPLVFPPLGPSAFILFRTPLAEQASPRSVILSHASALAAGLLSLRVAAALFPGSNPADVSALGPERIFAIASAMGLATIAMIGLRCSHPPAAATALIAAMGYLQSADQAVGLLAAVVLLVGEAIFFNRVLGGLPYPWWKSAPGAGRRYGALGAADEPSRWQVLESRVFRRRG